MLPREFISLYGTPTLQVRPVAIGVPYIISPNVDRYLLWVIPLDSLTINLVPDSQDDSSIFGSSGFGTVTSIITHAIHGALVNLGFRVTTTAPPGNIMVIQGFMPPRNKIIKELPTNGHSKHKRGNGIGRRR